MTQTLHHLVRRAQLGPGKPPVLILLHGVGSNERDMASLAPAMDPRFLVVSVRSPIELGPDAFAWFHVTFTPQGPAIEGAEAVEGWKTLTRFTRDIVDKYGGDASRVYIAGFSQGGIMALAALLTAPELIAGAVCMSGRLLPEILPHRASRELLAGKPVFIMHGTADNRLGIDYARSARTTLQELSLDLTYRELPMGHEITRDSLAQVTSWLSARLDAI